MRLINADTLEKDLQEQWENNEISNGDWILFREILNSQPTVKDTVMGFPAADLCRFADLCWRKGVEPDVLVQTLRDAGRIADMIYADIQERLYEAAHKAAAKLTDEDAALIDKVMSYTKEATDSVDS